MAKRGRLKSYFLRGLAVLLPTIVTIWILMWGYTFIQSKISIHINRFLVWAIFQLQGEPGITKERLTEILIEGPGSFVGFLIVLVIFVIAGAIFASVVGRTLWRIVEQFILNTPFLRHVYPYVKQVTDFILTPEEQKQMFSRVVAVEYPRAGIWSVGFVTGSGITRLVEQQKKEFLTILIPTSPTPFTGFVIMVPKEETLELDMMVEEAFRFFVSGGVITPQYNRGRLIGNTEVTNFGNNN